MQETGVDFRQEKTRMLEWLSPIVGNQPENDRPRRNSVKTPELRKIKFKRKKNDKILPGSKPKRGEMGENVRKITAFYEILDNQSIIKTGRHVQGPNLHRKFVTSNVGGGGEGSSGLGERGGGKL